MITQTKTALPTLLIGAACCLYFTLTGTATHCLTTGCNVYSGFTFLGISFYLWGFIFFSATLLAYFYKKRPAVYTSLIISALLGDALFLGYQLLFWPCLNCLMIATIIGALSFTVRFTPEINSLFRTFLHGAFLIWAFFFFAVSINAAKEIVMTPWSLTSPQLETAQVYFSPTCPSCRQTIQKILLSYNANNVRFIPIAKNSIDASRLAALPKNPSIKNISQLFDDDAPSANPTLIDKFRTFINKSNMASKGLTSVPAIVSNKVLETVPFLPFTALQPTLEKPSGSCSIIFNDPECAFPDNKN